MIAIFVSIGVILLFIFFMCVVICLYRRRNRRPPDTKTEEIVANVTSINDALGEVVARNNGDDPMRPYTPDVGSIAYS